MGQTDKELLLDMGFQPLRADLALKNTGGLQDALTWLEKHQDTPDDQLPGTQGGGSSSTAANTGPASGEGDEADEGAGTGDAGAEAKSYKCNECGKMLRSWNAVQFHAEKTGLNRTSEHQDFEESTEEIAPLTEEEKKARLEELKARLADKKKQQELDKIQEAKSNEAIRRKRDQDSEKMKEELRKKEMLKDVVKKKQEKLDDMKARARIKAEIAETQKQRKEAAARVKAEREGKVLEEQQQQPAAAAPSQPKPAHTEARLRFQISGRPPVMKTFPAETSLFEVASQLAADVDMEVKSFTTTFPPKKTFKLEEPLDSGMTLKEAGLTPSAALLVG